MAAKKGDLLICAVLGAFLTGALYPLAAPAVESATAGARVDWAACIAGFELSTVFRFWVSGAWIGHMPFIAAAFAISTLGVEAYASMKRSQSERAVEGGIYGDARVIKSRTELNRKNDFWDGKGKPRGVGLVLGATRRGYWYDSSVTHSLTCGKTGSGKSQLVVLETMHLHMAAGWNIISTGKPEILELTGDKARELGYEVIVLDFDGYPGASGYNPIDTVAALCDDGDIDGAVRSARRVATDLIPVGGEKNTYFPKAARNVLTACILIVCTAGIPRSSKNLASVAALVNRGTAGDDPKDPSKPLKDYIRALGEGHPAYAPASDLLSDGGATTAGKNVLSTLKEALSIFSDSALAVVTSESTVSMREIIENKTAVYIEMVDPDHPYGCVYNCFFSEYWQTAQLVCKEMGGSLPRPTALILDEVGNTGRIACLPSIATLGRAMHLREHLFVQNLKMLAAWNEPGDGGAGRDKLLGSIGLKVALSLSEPDDFRFFSKLVGNHTVRSKGTSDQRSCGRASTSTSYSETAVPLVQESEWQHRVPIRDGLLAVKGGENSKPGREGVFEFPLDYANRTPAGAFFGLGDEEEERAKRSDFYRRAAERAMRTSAEPPEPWCPNFCEARSLDAMSIDRDEWGAWDA